MIIKIRPGTPEDFEDIGYVHCTSWLETYAGLINSEYLAGLSPEESAEKFRQRNLENFLVLTVDDKIVGFAIMGPTRDRDLPASFGEIHAIYILRQYQKMGLGKKLLAAAIEKLRCEGYDNVSVWVLRANTASIEFYGKNGFVFDGTEQERAYVTPVTFQRYLLKRQ